MKHRGCVGIIVFTGVQSKAVGGCPQTGSGYAGLTLPVGVRPWRGRRCSRHARSLVTVCVVARGLLHGERLLQSETYYIEIFLHTIKRLRTSKTAQ